MKLIVDTIPYDRGRSGISAYIRGVVKALSALGHELVLITEPGVGAEFFPGYKTIEAPKWTGRAVFSMFWHLFFLPRKIKRYGADACLLLAANRRALCRYSIPTVAVVHDLSQYHVEAKYDCFRMFYIKRVLPYFVRRAHVVVAISRSTANDLVQYWHIPAEKIKVVYDGFDSRADNNAGTADKTPSAADSAAQPLLYISRIEHPGKNHVNLIRAYELLPDELAAKHPLVLVGGDWNGAEAVHAAAEASPRRDLIRFTGFAPTEEVERLWRIAAAYVFPSRFEGFGLSLLEAMDRGVPCACSSTSSLGELGEGVAELFDPEQPQAIADAMKKLLTADNTSRIAAGRAKAASFSWDRCARELLSAFPPAQVFGVRIDCETMQAALDRIIAAAKAKSDAKSTFLFVNAHCLNVAFKDLEYRDILNRADAVWPDGKGVAMAGDRLGFPVPENVNGTDMFPLLCPRLQSEKLSLFLFGARDGVAEKAAENSRAQYAGLNIVGCCHGYADEDEVVRQVNAAAPDVLLVALGVPLQEKWIARNRARLQCRVVIGVGGLLDFVSGRIPRAPLFMRRHGLEWLYRLYQEPRRMFRRYVIGNPLFLMRLRRK